MKNINLITVQTLQVAEMQSCPICCEDQPRLLSFSDCGHRFCQNCCIMHISEKADRFTQVLCADPSCKKQLDKHSEVYQILPANVVQKLEKYEEFTYLQKNNHLKPCSQNNCKGLIDTNQLKKECNKCKKAHCPKCLKQFHDGNCIMDKFDEEMKKNKFQKCPNCSIWVQKKQGCEYIDCKCGTAFCYRCGAQFASDPCRKGQLTEMEYAIKRQVSSLKYKLPESVIGYIILPLKFILQIVLFILLTVLCSIVLTLLILFKFLFVVMMSPCIALHILCHQLPDALKLCTLIFLPFLTAFLILIALFLLLMYPIFRNYYHHGVYDDLEKTISGGTKSYLGCVKGIFFL